MAAPRFSPAGYTAGDLTYVDKHFGVGIFVDPAEDRLSISVESYTTRGGQKGSTASGFQFS